MVRQAKVVRMRTDKVDLPYQNHAEGAGFRLSATTYFAYSNRFVVPIAMLMRPKALQGLNMK